MPIPEGASHEEIVRELIRSYKADGKIGNTRPRDMDHALEVANAIAYRRTKGGGRHREDTTD